MQFLPPAAAKLLHRASKISIYLATSLLLLHKKDLIQKPKLSENKWKIRDAFEVSSEFMTTHYKLVVFYVLQK